MEALTEEIAPFVYFTGIRSVMPTKGSEGHITFANMTSNTHTQLADRRKFEHRVEMAIHLCIWIYIFASPLLMPRRGDEIDWPQYFRRLYFPLTSCLLFYANYLYLVPRYLLDGKHYRRFAISNVLLILLLLASQEIYMLLTTEYGAGRGGRRPGKFSPEDFFRMKAMFALRNFISLAFIVGVAITVKLSMRWYHAENARKEAELRRREAELTNLRNQINPHFLLNTLNNIYALTAFDPDAARQAIEELSRLLRHVLYENKGEKVSIAKEAEFLKTYIALMRIRLADNMEVKVDIDIPEGDKSVVAPLIFISLVENAFKHGVSPTKHSFIRITLQADEKNIRFVCENSNFPKSANDKSPGGIGLQQVKSRLEHIYPGKYRWHHGTDETGEVYRSEIHISC